MSKNDQAGESTPAPTTAAPGLPPFPVPVSSTGASPSGTVPVTAEDEAGLGDDPASESSTGTAVAPTSDEIPGDDLPAGEDTPPQAPLKVPHTRTSATYIGVGIGLVILVLIIIFIAQNPNKSSVHFLGFHFKLGEGLIVLASAVAGGLVVLVVSLARVLQLRLMARRHRRAHQT